MKMTVKLWDKEQPYGVRLLRLCYAVGALFCLFFSIFPILLFGFANAGVFVLFLGALYFGAAYLYLPAIRKGKKKGLLRLHAAVSVVAAAGVVLWGSFAVYYRAYCASHVPPGDGAPQTVIVLGGAIEGDRPKLILARRLQLAAEYLAENRQAVCIVTGGQGPDEDYPEAEIMRRYLIELGVKPERVLKEDVSRNTRENISGAAAIIQQEGLSPEVTVVSDGFHQARAAYFCRQENLSSHALSSVTPWGLLPSYEVREMASWAKALMGL